MRIGSLFLRNYLILAPLAGVIRCPFRQLCRERGTGVAVTDMMSADPGLRATRKGRLRRDICREIPPYRRTGELLPRPVAGESCRILMHLENLYTFYGEYTGVRVALKSIAWHRQGRAGAAALCAGVNQAEQADAQLRKVRDYYAVDTLRRQAA